MSARSSATRPLGSRFDPGHDLRILALFASAIDGCYVPQFCPKRRNKERQNASSSNSQHQPPLQAAYQVPQWLPHFQEEKGQGTWDIECGFPSSTKAKTTVATTTDTLASASSILSLELLHHFTISTASTLATAPYLRDLKRVNVPQLGFTTQYILDAILAISGPRIARYNSVRRVSLLTQAAAYHTASLEGALPIITTITPKNCSPLFLFGVLTLLFNLVSPRRAEDMLIIGNGAVREWLYLLRGIRSLVRAESAIFSSAMAMIFQPTLENERFWTLLSSEESEFLIDLKKGICEKTAEDEPKRAVQSEAVDALNVSYILLHHEGLSDQDKLSLVYSWLHRVSDDYLALLKKVDEDALCVLAFFCVLLRELEKFWWFEGWSVHLIGRIFALLKDEYRLRIRWPIEQIGWVPEE
ncbi:hypothetical protein FZEAL_725 [Fusarium zealandicum]|uniref:Uncharacterized protein n=1 Tax=Fusarium zealandicum TaxID=1053134 RepID=A0A8H4UU86_9HYPO|nr:hypothetical protein FZEAL_725 [Fusarium zealandicum]